MTPRAVVTRTRNPAAEKILTDGGVPTLLARLLASRGVTDLETAKLGVSRLYSDKGMLGLSRAAERIADAIIKKERILIAGDFDCDGATATSVAVEGLTMLGAVDVHYKVPNRLVHGYGLTRDLVQDIAVKKPNLVITVDNGIAAVDGAAAATELGIDVVVTDHHLPGDSVPDCVAIVNPNQRGCPHPGKNLAGVGVMFYTLGAVKRALISKGALPSPGPRLNSLLDLVALGTVADVVKLDENNRILVKQGLSIIRSGNARPGIRALFEAAGKDERLASAEDFGFSLGPRINAAGRLDDMTWGIQCLLSKDMDTARHYAQELDRMNKERKTVETDMREQAEAQLRQLQLTTTGLSIVLYNPPWHQGVVGLLASRVKDAHYRPTIILTDGNPGTIKGSGRSVPELHLRDALDLVSKRNPGVILKFGGHAMAAGLTINADRLREFQDAFEAVVKELLPADALSETLETDGELDPGLLTERELVAVRESVWGQGFTAPSFVGKFQVLEQKILKNEHSKLTLDAGGHSLPALLFRHIEPLPPSISAVYRPVLNVFRGNTIVEAIIERVL